MTEEELARLRGVEERALAHRERLRATRYKTQRGEIMRICELNLLMDILFGATGEQTE